jgi:hypothetical protein
LSNIERWVFDPEMGAGRQRTAYGLCAIIES